MKVYTISELREMTDGSVPEAFSGRIKSVMKPISSKPGEEKPWKFQKLTVTDGKTEIQVVIDNRDDLPRSLEGSQIHAVAYRGDRGLGGLKRKDYCPTGKPVVPQLWVYDGAEMSCLKPDGTTAAPTATATAPTAAPATAPVAQEPTPAALDDRTPQEKRDAARMGAIKKYDQKVAKTSVAFGRCLDAAEQTVKDFNLRHGSTYAPSFEEIAKIAMGYLVNACWSEKPSDIEDFPTRQSQFYLAPTNGANGANTLPAAKGQSVAAAR